MRERKQKKAEKKKRKRIKKRELKWREKDAGKNQSKTLFFIF
jgi:hypothetical protein